MQDNKTLVPNPPDKQSIVEFFNRTFPVKWNFVSEVGLPNEDGHYLVNHVENGFDQDYWDNKSEDFNLYCAKRIIAWAKFDEIIFNIIVYRSAPPLSGLRMSENWISVQDDLPKDYKSCLVADNSGMVYIDKKSIEEDKDDPMNSFSKYYPIVFWKPLPETNASICKEERQRILDILTEREEAKEAEKETKLEKLKSLTDDEKIALLDIYLKSKNQ